MKITTQDLDKFPHRDRCAICDMRGIIIHKPVMPSIDFTESQDVAEHLWKVKGICVTCAETPTGCKSPNLGHKRLAESEYKAK